MTRVPVSVRLWRACEAAARSARGQGAAIVFGALWGSLCLLGGMSAAWWIDVSLGGAPWP